MSKRREIEQQQQTQERKQWITVSVIIAAIAIVVIGGAVILSNLTGGSTQTASSGRVLPAIKTSTTQAPPNAQANQRAWGPADAPVTIVEYIDYQCPFCGDYHKNIEPQLIEAFAASNKVRYEIRPLPFLDRGTTESLDSAQGSYCAADQNKFWEYHAGVFDNQMGRLTREENVGGYSKTRLKDIAATIPGIDAAAFNTCLDTDAKKANVQADYDEAAKRPVERTPSFLVNGKLISADARTSTVDGWKQIFAEVAPGVQIP